MQIVQIELSHIQARLAPCRPDDEMRIEQMMRRIAAGEGYEPIVVAPVPAAIRKRNFLLRFVQWIGRKLYDAFPLNVVLSGKWTPDHSRTLRPVRVHRGRRRRSRGGPPIDRFEILEGHIEIEALRRLGIETVDCLVMNLSQPYIALHQGMNSTDQRQSTLHFQARLFRLLQPRLKTYAKMSSRGRHLRSALYQPLPPQADPHPAPPLLYPTEVIATTVEPEDDGSSRSGLMLSP